MDLGKCSDPSEAKSIVMWLNRQSSMRWIEACIGYKRFFDDAIDFGTDDTGKSPKELEAELDKGGAALTGLYEALHVAKSYSTWES